MDFFKNFFFVIFYLNVFPRATPGPSDINLHNKTRHSCIWICCLLLAKRLDRMGWNFCGHSKIGGGVFFKGTMPGPSASYLIIVKVGELKEELSLFWEKSRHLMGWNGAHNSFPHITLSSSFTCPDSQVEALMHAISKVFIYKNI